MKDWIKNHKEAAQIISAITGAVIGLTVAVIICGTDATSSIAEVVNVATESSK